jgi:hypothetical protein
MFQRYVLPPSSGQWISVCTSETSVHSNETTWRCILEDFILAAMRILNLTLCVLVHRVIFTSLSVHLHVVLRTLTFHTKLKRVEPKLLKKYSSPWSHLVIKFLLTHSLPCLTKVGCALSPSSHTVCQGMLKISRFFLLQVKIIVP